MGVAKKSSSQNLNLFTRKCGRSLFCNCYEFNKNRVKLYLKNFYYRLNEAVTKGVSDNVGVANQSKKVMEKQQHKRDYYVTD